MSRKVALLLLVFTNILWGSSYAVTKVALAEIPPPLLGALRVILASVLLWPILIWHTRAQRLSAARLIEPMPLSDALRLVGLGLLGIGMSYLLDYWGISLSTATDAALMIIGEVIFTALLAAWLLSEHIGKRKRLGITIGIAGLLLLVFGNRDSSQTGPNAWSRVLGDILILTCLLCESIYTVLGAKLTRTYHPLKVLTLAHTGSLLIWLPILFWYVASGSFPALSLGAIGGVLYLAGITSALCYLVWFSVLRVAGSSIGAVSLFVQPLVGSVLGIVVLGDPLTPALGIGALLIFGALYVMSLPERAVQPGSNVLQDDISRVL